MNSSGGIPPSDSKQRHWPSRLGQSSRKEPGFQNDIDSKRKVGKNSKKWKHSRRLSREHGKAENESTEGQKQSQ